MLFHDVINPVLFYLISWALKNSDVTYLSVPSTLHYDEEGCDDRRRVA